MPYCCVPRCKSSSKQRTPGISFHEIQSDPELRAKWLKVISRDDWTTNTTSCYSTLCSRHFGSSDFKESCEIRKLKKDAVPSSFEDYPPYLQLPKKRERSEASVRKREAAAPVKPGHQETLLKLLLTKFFRPIFTNFALKATDKHDVAKLFEIMPLSRKTLKL
ncbi:hypothetical protein HPB51_018546 [Rhipicephalus microplus]|uniref:THAP-type domain-containing protein n=1 Tax=Rhipicephalus microplus TaxID=6941 RepID=A0A9J6DIU2_RHIMP|nr:hypothetical protein HPB51_018546 [Rhipicephalus microplus]